MISVHDLKKLLINLSMADETEGGALIPFKKQMLSDPKFMDRQLMALEIPTFTQQEIEPE